jgi:hypothetical protein
MADADLPVAESAYATLLDARHKPRNVAAALVRQLRTETRNEADRPHKIEMAQAEAWLAICALSIVIIGGAFTASRASRLIEVRGNRPYQSEHKPR